MSVNICTVYLSINEGLAYQLDSSEHGGPGPWLSLAEERARSKGLPGILARILLLKAEMYHKHGDIDEVRHILAEVQDLIESWNLDYLHLYLDRLLNSI